MWCERDICLLSGGIGAAYPFGTPKFHLGLFELLLLNLYFLCVDHCIYLVLLFLWSLYCVSIFKLVLLITFDIFKLFLVYHTHFLLITRSCIIKLWQKQQQNIYYRRHRHNYYHKQSKYKESVYARYICFRNYILTK